MDIKKISIRTEITYETELWDFYLIVEDDNKSVLMERGWEVIREYKWKDLDETVMNQNAFLDNYLGMWEI